MHGNPSVGAAVTLAASLLLACNEADPSSSDADESAGSTDESGTTDEPGATSETDETDAPTDTGESGETGEASSCPAPELEPMIVEDDSVFCSEGFAFDLAYRMCVSETEAIGPFPPAMVAACEQCGGIDCAGSRWPVEQARGLRGTDPCWPGTTAFESICVDDEHAWGPFSPAMVTACKAAGGGEVTCESMRWARDFAESLLPPKLGADWAWILPLDYGLRDDAGGGGAFSAPRLNNPGGHSGIDVLAPVGTPLLAACEGPVLVGYDSGYGNYVQLSCPIPTVIAGTESLWASILYAHLDSTAVASGETVSAGQMIGTVGKSGNAASPTINPHVHFEAAIHSSLAAAQAESHASANHAGNEAGDLFAPRFASQCLDVIDLSSTTGPTMKGRRPDPFMLLTCLSSDKPELDDPTPTLQASWTQWSDHYASTLIDVDVGL